MQVLIAGGGVAALEAALAVRALAEERVSIVVLAPEQQFVYRPALVAEPFGRAAARRFDLARLFGELGIVVRRGALSAVEADRHRLRTDTGEWLEFDALVIACGAVTRESVRGALTFAGEGADVRALLDELEAGAVRRIVFAVPAGVGWPIPLYELAMLTTSHLQSVGARTGVEITIVTPEASPLVVFGDEAAQRVAELLDERGIRVLSGHSPIAFVAGSLRLLPPSALPADRVVALPRLVGAPITGIPHDGEGFIRTDAHGRVDGLEDVYAAGDITAFPVKQGGLATQQADAVAESIAASAGAPIEPQPFAPMLRGMLLTSAEPLSIRSELRGGHGADVTLASSPLWWPPSKIAGRYLAPFLASRERGASLPVPDGRNAIHIERPL